MRKKLFSMLLLALSISIIITSCSDGDIKPAESLGVESSATDTAETIDEYVYDNLPEADFDGYTFTYFMRDNDSWVEDMFAEELNGDSLNDAVFSRNSDVANRFNVNFALCRSSNANYEADALSVILAGEDSYDLIFPHAFAVFSSYMLGNALLNWKTDLPYIDLNQPWWYADAVDNLSVGGQLYAMTGDISYKAIGSTIVMVFNKGLFDDMNIEYPYESVKNGTWTFDNFEQIVKKGVKDINNDGEMELTKDSFGYVTYVWRGPQVVLWALGSRMTEKDSDDLPEIVLNSDHTIEIYNRFFNMIDSTNSYIDDNTDDNDLLINDLKIDAFEDNRVLITDFMMSQITWLRGMDTDFGVIPWPKYDENQDDYCTVVDAGMHLACVPVTAADPERTSIIIEALACIGYNSIVPTFYEEALKTKYSRDDESAEMLDLIRESIIFDFGYYANIDGVSNIGCMLASNRRLEFSSTYAKYAKSAEQKLEKYYKLADNK